MCEELKYLSYAELRNIYKDYLTTLNISKLTQNTAAVEAFYLWRHGSKELFWNIVLDENFEETAKIHISGILNRNSKGNKIKLTSNYYSHLKRFRDFALRNTGQNIYKHENMENLAPIKNQGLIPYPCVAEIDKYLNKWDKLANYRLQEDALDKLFYQLCPENKEVEDVLLKCATLNDFYSTNIFSIYPVAKHIVELNIDGRLQCGDVKLVDDIQHIVISGKVHNYYSFATKYCSHHNPEQFPIYDSYVEKILCYFLKNYHFSSFKKSDLKNYTIFKTVLADFRKYYNLTDYSLKQIDRYIWQLGKEYFPKKYK